MTLVCNLSGAIKCLAFLCFFGMFSVVIGFYVAFTIKLSYTRV